MEAGRITVYPAGTEITGKLRQTFGGGCAMTNLLGDQIPITDDLARVVRQLRGRKPTKVHLAKIMRREVTERRSARGSQLTLESSRYS